MIDVRGRVLVFFRIEYGGRVGSSGEFSANDLIWFYCFVVEYLDVWWESFKGLIKNDIFMWWWEKIIKDIIDLYFKLFIYFWGFYIFLRFFCIEYLCVKCLFVFIYLCVSLFMNVYLFFRWGKLILTLIYFYKYLE